MALKSLAQTLRDLRKARNLTLREVATSLGIDIAVLSKMERGLRPISRESVIRFARFYDQDPDKLLVQWLSENIEKAIEEEEALGPEALQMAEDAIAYKKVSRKSKETYIAEMRAYLASNPKVEAAWLFGSFVRGDETPHSDIDIMIRFHPTLPISFFDLADIQEALQSITHRKIDLVEEGQLSPFAMETAKHDLRKIYG